MLPINSISHHASWFFLLDFSLCLCVSVWEGSEGFECWSEWESGKWSPCLHRSSPSKHFAVAVWWVLVTFTNIFYLYIVFFYLFFPSCQRCVSGTISEHSQVRRDIFFFIFFCPFLSCDGCRCSAGFSVAVRWINDQEEATCPTRWSWSTMEVQDFTRSHCLNPICLLGESCRVKPVPIVWPAWSRVSQCFPNVRDLLCFLILIFFNKSNIISIKYYLILSIIFLSILDFLLSIFYSFIRTGLTFLLEFLYSHYEGQAKSLYKGIKGVQPAVRITRLFISTPLYGLEQRNLPFSK